MRGFLDIVFEILVFFDDICYNEATLSNSLEKTMKKLISLLLFVSMFVSLLSCSDKSTLKLEDTLHCADCSIKFSSDKNAGASYYITPEGFEWDKLEENGYKMRVTVSYKVYYEKDWSLGFGYAGSPKYEISVVNADGMGKLEKDLSTTTSSQIRTLSFTSRIVDIKDTKLILTFSTDNIQNIIYFKNITVDYECYR